ncbi:MAG TPA: DUF1552 domain-containing protein, partial [Planctomycetaceae bacterium]|nr:DUF1552 domain-containing protein [Planctomycetaceae bacterium]
MNHCAGFTLSRRHVLRGAGTALALPLLDAMLPRGWGAPSTFAPWRKSEVVQPRMICCYVPNGVNILEWVPANDGPDYTLSPTLDALKEHRGDFTVLSGLGHPHSEGGHSGADTWLTAANLKAKPGADYTNTVSVDQLAAELHGRQTR